MTALPIFVQRCYVELVGVLLQFKNTQCDKRDLAEAIVRAASEAGVERHLINQVYDDLRI